MQMLLGIKKIKMAASIILRPIALLTVYKCNKYDSYMGPGREFHQAEPEKPPILNRRSRISDFPPGCAHATETAPGECDGRLQSSPGLKYLLGKEGGAADKRSHFLLWKRQGELIKNSNWDEVLKMKTFCETEMFRHRPSAAVPSQVKPLCPKSDYPRFHKLTENPPSRESKLSLLCLQLWLRIEARLFTVLINAPFQRGTGEGKWTGSINRCSSSCYICAHSGFAPD